MTLIAHIKTAQAQRGWTNIELSRRLGISESVSCRILNGTRQLDNFGFLRAVARVFPELRWQVTKYIIGGNKIGEEHGSGH